MVKFILAGLESTGNRIMTANRERAGQEPLAAFTHLLLMYMRAGLTHGHFELRIKGRMKSCLSREVELACGKLHTFEIGPADAAGEPVPNIHPRNEAERLFAETLTVIKAGLHHGHFELCLICEIGTRADRIVTLKAGRSYRFIIPFAEVGALSAPIQA